MRVKIGDTWYDAKDVAICIEMSEMDIDNIKAMREDVAPNRRYATFPNASSLTPDQMREWMSK